VDDAVLCMEAADWLLLLPSDGARRWPPWYESTVPVTPGDCTEYRLHNMYTHVS